jgi:tetratricopeptide (TPR) repeat protein
LIVLALVGLVYLTRRWGRVVIFGMLFFLVNLALVLQFVSVGQAITAERYTYIAYIGIFYIIAAGLFRLTRMGRMQAVASISIFASAVVVFSYMTYERCKVWKDSETLWTDQIDKYPQDSEGLANRGSYYADQGEMDRALIDFTESLKRRPVARVFVNRGNVYGTNGQHELALADYDQAVSMRPDYMDAYVNRAITYSMMQQYDKAFADYARAEELEPGNRAVYVNRGHARSGHGDYDAAISDYTTAIGLGANEPSAYLHRGLAYFNKQDYSSAMRDFTRLIDLLPDAADGWYNRSLCHNALGNYQEALGDARQAQRLGLAVNEAYLNHLQSRVAPN